MITRGDLNWWLELAPTLDWTFAKTYAKTAPHKYIVEGRTDAMEHDDYVRAARVIHTFGTPGRYYSLTKIYLVSPDGRHRWWTEDNRLTDTTLVNRATTERFYGIQNAPSTATSAESPYDQVATTWDVEHPIVGGEVDRAEHLLAGVRGPYPPHVLDVGCGTGRVLDLGLVTPDRYAGLDSSQAMLNMLVRKHPKVAAVYPVDIVEALRQGLFTPGQFDWVFFDDTVQLSEEHRQQVGDLARLAVITVTDTQWTVVEVTERSIQRNLALSEAMGR